MNFARKKRVTDPLNDEAKARLIGGDFRQLSGVSSGSEHSGTGECDSSLSLSELVYGFLEEDNENESDSAGNDFDSERVDSVTDCMESVKDLLQLSDENANADSYMKMLRSHVSEAAVKFAFLKKQNVSLYNRNVMSFLREKGYNAAICKTRWDSSGGLTAGNHEFIDVVRSESSTWQNNRYFVELNFAGQFEIARPTNRYSEILSYVPEIFVGKSEELKRTVLALCGAVKLCLRSGGLSIPPWRKNRYMQNKWFGPYRRTTNPVQGNPVPAVSSYGGAKCRLVGFEDAVSETRRGGASVRTR